MLRSRGYVSVKSAVSGSSQVGTKHESGFNTNPCMFVSGVTSMSNRQHAPYLSSMHKDCQGDCFPTRHFAGSTLALIGSARSKL